MSELNFRYKINRAEELFVSTLFDLMPQLEKLDRKIFFTYWTEKPYDFLEANGDFADFSVFKLIKSNPLNELSNKRELPKLLAAKNINDVFPRTYTNKVDALEHDGPPIDFWFLKNIYGTSGKGMRCISNTQLEHYPIPQNYVIQEGVGDIKLYEGKKFTNRIYVLIWNKKTYLFNNGFNIVHGTKYITGSTDYEVQIKHEGYRNRNSPIKMIPFNQYEHYGKYFAKFQEAVKKLLPAFARTMDESSPGEYVMLGIDAILLDNGDVRFIEINSTPNFIHTNTINQQVNLPFFKASLVLMFGLQTTDDLLLIE